MTPFAQLCLLIRCALGSERGSAAVIAAAPLDGAALVSLSARHRIAPFLYALVTDPEIGVLLPAELREGVTLLHDANKVRNEQLHRELVDLVGLLNRAGIEPVLLKGAARLVDGTYPDEAARFMQDLDLLLPQDQLAAGVSCLKAAGYASSAASERLPDEHHHSPSLHREGTLASVELHHSVLPHWHQALLPAQEMIARSSRIDLGGCHGRIPAPMHSVVHLIAHGQLQHGRFASGGMLLLDTVEFMLLARQAGVEAVQGGFDRALALGLGLPFATFLRGCELITRTQVHVRGVASVPARLLARRAIWQQDHHAIRAASRLLAHLIRTAIVFHRFPSIRHRFPRRFTERSFYSNRWREARNLIGI